MCLISALSASLLLGGCFLFYFPLVILAPFQPILILVARVVARYGPILLMLVETTPQLPGEPPTMIAMQPAAITRQTKLPDLEEQIIYELYNNKELKSIMLVEGNAMTPEWLEEQVRLAYDHGCRVRAVFVDSRKFGSGRKLSRKTVEAFKNTGVSLKVTEGLAESVVDVMTVAERVPIGPRQAPPEYGAAYACLMSAVPAAL